MTDLETVAIRATGNWVMYVAGGVAWWVKREAPGVRLVRADTTNTRYVEDEPMRSKYE